MSRKRYGDNIKEKVWDGYIGDVDKGEDIFGHEIHWEDYEKDTHYGWNLDHIWPKQPLKSDRKGSNHFTNLQPLCIYCNENKSNKMSGKIDGQRFGVKPAGERGDKMVGRMVLL